MGDGAPSPYIGEDKENAVIAALLCGDGDPTGKEPKAGVKSSL